MADHSSVSLTQLYDLYEKVNAQANTLLSELDAFAEYMTARAAHNPSRNGVFKLSDLEEQDCHIGRFHHGVSATIQAIGRIAKKLPPSPPISSPHDSDNTTPNLRGGNRSTDSDDLGSSDPEKLGSLHASLRTTNLPSHIPIWALAKSLPCVLSISRQCKYDPSDLSATSSETRSQTSRDSVTVDVVADRGLTWYKVVTLDAHRLAMELAKEGICEGELADMDKFELDSVLRELRVVRSAREYIAASRRKRVDFRKPQIRFVFTKVRTGLSADVDILLDYLQGLGVVIEYRPELIGPTIPIEKEALKDVFERMLSVQTVEADVSSTLNLDATILIALVSDISHVRQGDVDIPPHYTGHNLRDLEMEFESDVDAPLLPSQIYPVLAGRSLVCTSLAADHVRNIITTMGSEAEKRRCEYFLPGPGTPISSEANYRTRLQSQSIHEVPSNLKLPIVVQTFNPVLASAPTLSQADCQIALLVHSRHELTAMNRSTMLHGWMNSLTTLSRNRAVVAWVDRLIGNELNVLEKEPGQSLDNSFTGPHIVLTTRDRSLLGSERKRCWGGTTKAKRERYLPLNKNDPHRQKARNGDRLKKGRALFEPEREGDEVVGVDLGENGEERGIRVLREGIEAL